MEKKFILTLKEFKALKRIVRIALDENRRDIVAHRPQLFNPTDLDILEFKEEVQD